MSDIIKLSPFIYELDDTSNNIYMTLKMVILTTNTNLNGTCFTEDFIDGIVSNQEKFQGIPLVVERSKLESQMYNSLTHAFDGTSLRTDMIGSFVAFEKRDNEDGSFSLLGEARVMKRFPKTCAAIVDLYSQEKLLFSCEALIRQYDNVNEEGTYREVNYNSGMNNLIANTIVTSPAEVDAKPTLLVASLNEDLNINIESDTPSDLEINVGGANMSVSMSDLRKMMNEAMDELAEKMMARAKANAILSGNEVNIDSLVEPMCALMGDCFTEEPYCYFWVSENCVFPDYFACQDYYSGNMFMFDYSMSEADELTISNPRKAKFVLVETAEQVMEAMAKEMSSIFKAKRDAIAKLETKEVEIANLTSEKEAVETEIATLKDEKAAIETELATAKDQIALKDSALATTQTEANEKIISLGSVVEDLKTELEKTKPLVAEFERVQAELAAQAKAEAQEKLRQYAINSKVISVTEIAENEELKQAIEELNEVKVKEIIADRIVKANIEASSLPPKNDDVVVVISEKEDLIVPSIAEKYGLI